MRGNLQAMKNLDTNTIINIEENNPNNSMESLYHHVTYLLDSLHHIKTSLIEKFNLRQDHGSLNICYI